jgi:nitrate/nitrite-specific signal transduction histidine kinase
LRKGGTGLITFKDDKGISWHAYGSTLDNGWAIISQQQEAEILAPARNFQSVAYSLISVGSLLLLALVWYSIRRTLQPINELTETASAIAGGDLSRNIVVNSQDELGVLARTFNSMTQQLRTIIGNLEQRVAARTHDLALASEVGRVVSERAVTIDE